MNIPHFQHTFGCIAYHHVEGVEGLEKILGKASGPMLRIYSEETQLAQDSLNADDEAWHTRKRSICLADASHRQSSLCSSRGEVKLLSLCMRAEVLPNSVVLTTL